MSVAALDAFPTESGGAELLRLAPEEGVRKGRAAGEIPTHHEEPTMPGGKPEVRLAGEDLDILRDEMKLAAEAGAKKAVDTLLTEDRARAFFSVFFKVLREEMRAGAGDWVLGRAWWGLRLVGGIALLCLILLVIGGPGLLKAMWGVVWSHATGNP
jgi:hypothetical protein